MLPAGSCSSSKVLSTIPQCVKGTYQNTPGCKTECIKCPVGR